MESTDNQAENQPINEPESHSDNQLEEFIQREKAKIVGETAKAPWKELERFYAQGILILVSDTLDLVEVGYTISIDDADQIKQWMDAGLLVKNFDSQAIAWEKDNADVWTVVIRPWVLVQAMND